MKKKLLLFIILLTIIFIPLTASAATTYTYTRECPELSKLDYIKESWAGKTYKVSSGLLSGQGYGLNVFCFHAINGDAGLCGGIGKSTVPDASVTEYLFNGNPNPINDITNNNGEKITGGQLDNLKDLMSNGFQFETFDSILNNKENQKKYIAMQVLIWEVLEGGRTSFNYTGENGYAPNWNGDAENKSAYQIIIEQNPEIAKYYKKAIENVFDAQQPAEANNLDKNYTLKWNTQSKKYVSDSIDVGRYKNCSSDNNKVTVSVSSDSKLTLTSNSIIEKATITCSYIAGNGTQEEDVFHYYAFGKNLCDGGCQNILYGKTTKKYSKSFKVSTESAKIEIVKVDESGKKVSGSQFLLKNRNDSSYNVKIAGNASDPTVINKSDTYIVSEINIPNGYSGISDFYLTINARDGKVIDCTNKQTSGSTITCLNGKVKITKVNDKISMQIVNSPKSYKLMKIDENNNPVLGAGFEIRKTDNTKLKFKLVNGIYTYDTSGTVTVLKNNKANTYQIALLPVGEYNVVEVSAPYPYLISEDESQRTTRIKITNKNTLLVYNDKQKTFVTSSEIVVKNYKSEVIINKTGLGKPLEGVKFLLYDGNKEEFIKSSMTKAGEYTYIQNQSTAENNNYVTDTSGNIKIYNLPVGTYYLREVETISPYVLPEGEAAYTKIKIDVTKEGLVINDSKTSKTINISNSPYTFNFYKVNEEGAYLSGGKFKIQKYNNEKNRYIDIKIKSVSNDGSYLSNADIFEPSSEGTTKFTLKNGIATFINMEASSQYRIVELEAPSGYEKSETNDTVEVTIDQFGNASGMLTLVNENIVVEEGGSSAELIVNISTGMDRVSYSLIIGGIIVSIGIMFVIIKKVDKNKKNK